MTRKTISPWASKPMANVAFNNQIQELFGGVNRICATQGKTTGANTELNDGTNTQVLTYSVHRTGRAAAFGIRIGVTASYVSGVSPFGEVADPAVIKKVMLELPDGTQIQGNFNGADQVSLVSGSGVVYSDPIGAYIPPNTEFFIKVWTIAPNTTTTLRTVQTVSITGKQRACKGTDLTSQFTTFGVPVGGTTCKQIPPVSIVAILDRPQMCVLVTGDSIADGTDDISTDLPHGEYGFIARALVDVNGFDVPHVKATKGGELLKAFATSNTGWRRASMLSSATHYFSNFGSNDCVVGNGLTIDQIKAYYIKEWTLAKMYGLYTIQATIIPRVTGISTTQVPYVNFEPNGTSHRDVLNKWFFEIQGKGLLDRVIDIRPAVEDVANNPGYWKNGLTDTADGIHLSSAAHINIARNYVNPVFAELDRKITGQ
jgi:lysophospholipase L1-like esterase